MSAKTCATCRFCQFDEESFPGYVVDVCENPSSDQHTHMLTNIEESGCDAWEPEADDAH